MIQKTAAKQLAEFLEKYEPGVAKLARGALAALRRRLPGAFELVYDNYNALAIAFSPSDTSSAAIFSIAVYPRWVSLFFAQGARLPDPKKILKGSGPNARKRAVRPVASTAPLDQGSRCETAASSRSSVKNGGYTPPDIRREGFAAIRLSGTVGNAPESTQLLQ